MKGRAAGKNATRKNRIKKYLQTDTILYGIVAVLHADFASDILAHILYQ